MNDPLGSPWIHALLAPDSPPALRAEAASRLAQLSQDELLAAADRYREAVDVVPRQSVPRLPVGLRRRMALRLEEVRAATRVALVAHPADWRVVPPSREGYVAACESLLSAPPVPLPASGAPSLRGLRSAWLPIAAVELVARRAVTATGPTPAEIAIAAQGGVELPLPLAREVVALHRHGVPLADLELALGRLHAHVGLAVESETWLPLPLRLVGVVADVVAKADRWDPRLIDRLERVAWHWAVARLVSNGLFAGWEAGRLWPTRFDVLEALDLLEAEITEPAWLAVPPAVQGAIQRMGHMLEVASGSRA